jgi:glycosyltransferase involved in cell wall biosynthesis
MSKKKIIVLSDHALSTSGVGTQTRHLINGLVAKNRWTFRQFGAAIKHSDYRTVAVNDDFIIKPIDGFGNRDLIRVTLATEKPDGLLIFTDPRFFTWLFEIEDEVRQICPVMWWHVWDNKPFPDFNDWMYRGTDLINCHSYLTYEMVKERYPDKTNFVPHAIPGDVFFPMSDNTKKMHRQSILGPKSDYFVALWINRNARRKRPSDVMMAWKIFVDDLHRRHGHKKAVLIMHTDPLDQEGPNLVALRSALGIEDNVIFSPERVDFSKINILYNISDVTVNISFAEGFGLSTLESMQTGTPVIALKTGGLTRQVVDHRDGSHNGVALDVEMQTLVGSQQVPYIYEDYVSCETLSRAFMKMFEMSDVEKSTLSRKVRDYVSSEFDYDRTVSLWDQTMLKTIEDFPSRKRWRISSL